MARNITTHLLHAFKRTLAYAETPDGTGAAHPLVRRVHATAAALLDLNERLANREDTLGEYTDLQVEMAKTRAAMQAVAEQLAKQRAEFYTPPPTTDTVLDSELRTWLRSLSVEQRSVVMAQVSNGELPELRDALVRFPAPLPEAEVARGLYKAEVELKYPEIVENFGRQQAALDWTESTLEAVAGIVAEATSMGKLDAGVLVTE